MELSVFFRLPVPSSWWCHQIRGSRGFAEGFQCWRLSLLCVSAEHKGWWTETQPPGCWHCCHLWLRLEPHQVGIMYQWLSPVSNPHSVWKVHVQIIYLGVYSSLKPQCYGSKCSLWIHLSVSCALVVLPRIQVHPMNPFKCWLCSGCRFLVYRIAVIMIHKKKYPYNSLLPDVDYLISNPQWSVQ